MRRASGAFLKKSAQKTFDSGTVGVSPPGPKIFAEFFSKSDRLLTLPTGQRA
jgi:hypothetical protein